MNEWIPVNDMARLLGVTYQAAGQLIQRKQFRTKLVNGRRFVSRADVMREKALRDEVAALSTAAV